MPMTVWFVSNNRLTIWWKFSHYLLIAETIMHTFITWSSLLCTIAAETVFDKGFSGITNDNLMSYPIPANASRAKLRNNAISWVPTEYFKNASGLLEIELCINRISDIQDLAFAAVPSVTKIVLYSNKLSVIRKLMFSGLPRLEVLKLHKNEIHTLEVDCFKENTALHDMTLNHNEIQRLPRCIFDKHHHPTNLGTLSSITCINTCSAAYCNFWHNPVEIKGQLTRFWFRVMVTDKFEYCLVYIGWY